MLDVVHSISDEDAMARYTAYGMGGNIRNKLYPLRSMVHTIYEEYASADECAAVSIDSAKRQELDTMSRAL